jgi:hypothetical protein
MVRAVDPSRWYRDALWEAKLPPEQKLIGLCYAKYSNGKTAYVTRDTLQRECGFGSTTRGRKHLEALVASGWLAPTGEERNRCDVYYLAAPGLDGAQDMPDPIDQRRADGARDNQDGARGVPRSGTPRSKMGHAASRKSKDSGEAKESVGLRAGAQPPAAPSAPPNSQPHPYEYGRFGFCARCQLPETNPVHIGANP